MSPRAAAIALAALLCAAAARPARAQATAPQPYLLTAELRRPDQVLAVTLLPHPNAARKKKPYRDQIVAGVAAAAPGYRLLERKDGEPSSSWTIDLIFERRVDGAAEVVAMRFYLVHDRTLILTVTTPVAAWPAAKAGTLRLLRSFKPRPA